MSEPRTQGGISGTMKVFVHLPPDFDAKRWNERWRAGTVVGINEPFPYGYHRARDMGCAVTFSTGEEGRSGRLMRLGIRALLGFDLVHAWRNRTAIRAADVVWTHTESHGLGVAAVLAATRARRTALLLQSVWLIDRWPNYPRTHRWMFRRLLRSADVLTFLSSVNRAVAAGMFPGKRCEVVHFGIRADEKRAPRAPRSAGAVSVLALGNDEHRDWPTVVAAVELLPDAELTVASRTFPGSLGTVHGVTVVSAADNTQLQRLFDTADLVVLTLRPNAHASGLTVLQEAILQGLPVVVTETGGLAEYFDDTMVHFVPPGDPAAVATAVEAVRADPRRTVAMAEAAQRRMSSTGISSEAYIRRHVELSQELVSR